MARTTTSSPCATRGRSLRCTCSDPAPHVASLDEAEALSAEASARALAFIAATARSAGVAETGYRVITNTGPHAGQEVMHLHWHVVGGTRLGGMV